MSCRPPLPLRLLQSHWKLPTTKAAVPSSHVLAVYKPSGLPFFSSSQVAAVGDGRQLFSIKRTTPTGEAHAAAQPSPDDASDSVMSRVVDSLPPGSTPYIALPSVSPLLLDRTSHAASSSATVNAWTAREKGVVLVALSQGAAFFIRNAARVGLVQCRYHVLCRLPPEVAARARRSLQKEHNETLNGQPDVANPYLRSWLEKRYQAGGGQSVQRKGICLKDERGRLPAGLHHDVLLRGGFVNMQDGTLLRQGTLSGVLRHGAPLTEVAQAALQKIRRFNQLFQTAVGESRGGQALDTPPSHPWLPQDCLLQVSTDIKMGSIDGRIHGSDETHEGAAIALPAGRRVDLHFDLLTLSEREGGVAALYEVHGTLLTADEVKALFAAEGFLVFNDFVHDRQLAMWMEEVADTMRRAPPRVMADLPIGLQRAIRSATAEELVALPLVSQPADCTDQWALQKLLRDVTEHPPDSSQPRSFAGRGAEDGSDHLQHLVKCLEVFHQSRHLHPVKQILLQHLSTLQDREKYRAIMQLTIGPGVECTDVTFPDPAYLPNVHTLQHIVMDLEEKQRLHSRHDEWAAEMRMISRSVHHMTPVKGIDILGRTRGAVDVATVKCSFSIACALHTIGAEASTEATASSDTERMANTASPLEAAASLTHVPETYADLFAMWIPKAGSPAATYWVPGAERLKALCSASSARPVGANQSNERSVETHEADGIGGDRALAHIVPPAPVPLFCRVEELGEFTCATCGLTGHPWQQCPQAELRLPARAMASLPELPASEGKVLHVVEEELITSVDQVRDALHAPQSDVNKEVQHWRAGIPDEEILPVPNVAPTVALNPHALQHERQKPAMHRRSLHCAYCGGRHHITACPKLQDGSQVLLDGASASSMDAEQLTRHRDKLFCIKCGQHGHLYTHCPLIPHGLSPSSHCPICHLTNRKHHHSPSKCPRRVAPPEKYLPSGVPLICLGASQGPRRLQQKRKRRGSMLMADSFVDSQ